MACENSTGTPPPASESLTTAERMEQPAMADGSGTGDLAIVARVGRHIGERVATFGRKDGTHDCKPDASAGEAAIAVPKGVDEALRRRKPARKLEEGCARLKRLELLDHRQRQRWRWQRGRRGGKSEIEWRGRPTAHQGGRGRHGDGSKYAEVSGALDVGRRRLRSNRGGRRIADVRAPAAHVCRPKDRPPRPRPRCLAMPRPPRPPPPLPRPPPPRPPGLGAGPSFLSSSAVAVRR